MSKGSEAKPSSGSPEFLGPLKMMRFRGGVIGPEPWERRLQAVPGRSAPLARKTLPAGLEGAGSSERRRNSQPPSGFGHTVHGRVFFKQRMIKKGCHCIWQGILWGHPDKGICALAAELAIPGQSGGFITKNHQSKLCNSHTVSLMSNHSHFRASVRNRWVVWQLVTHCSSEVSNR